MKSHTLDSGGNPDERGIPMSDKKRRPKGRPVKYPMPVKIPATPENVLKGAPGDNGAEVSSNGDVAGGK